jgi:hypothetical protein
MRSSFGLVTDVNPEIALDYGSSFLWGILGWERSGNA